MTVEFVNKSTVEEEFRVDSNFSPHTLERSVFEFLKGLDMDISAYDVATDEMNTPYYTISGITGFESSVCLVFASRTASEIVSGKAASSELVDVLPTHGENTVQVQPSNLE
ncbi:hypothetical protein [Halobacteriaceae bacterium SHR40]|uniref:hypothetical protein n=1 Tax=Halovenus amylolytica TaxID=2500550 RepID=UPI000FE2E226